MLSNNSSQQPVPVRGGLGYWCCTDGSTSPDIENPDDRVEVSRFFPLWSWNDFFGNLYSQVAFRRLDFNRDGYLTEEDFLEVVFLNESNVGGLWLIFWKISIPTCLHRSSGPWSRVMLKAANFRGFFNIVTRSVLSLPFQNNLFLQTAYVLL